MQNENTSPLTIADYIEIITNIATTFGIIAAGLFVFWRWCASPGRPLIKRMMFIPPYFNKKLSGPEYMLGGEFFFVNFDVNPEVIRNLEIFLFPPRKWYQFPKKLIARPYFFAKTSALISDENTSEDEYPEWISGLYHPFANFGKLETEKFKGMIEEKLIIFLFRPQDNFVPKAGKYRVSFVVTRFSSLPWRRKSRGDIKFKWSEDFVRKIRDRERKTIVTVLTTHIDES